MDYKRWVEDALAFTRNLSRLQGELEVTCEAAPPLSAEELASISSHFPSGIPKELARFWTEGSAHLNCSFTWEPEAADMPAFRKVFPAGSYLWGGASFCPVSFVKPKIDAIDESEIQCELDDRVGALVSGFLTNLGSDSETDSTTKSLPELPFVIHLPGNGDRLALNPEASGADQDDPPVVLLNHDVEKMRLVADRFTKFLQSWQRWSYIGVDRLGWWPATNYPGMEPDGEKASALRALLQRT